MNHRFAIAVLFAFFALAGGGCGHHYHLAGHNAKNLQRPPDIHIKAGESTLAVTEGPSIGALILASSVIRIQDEGIARVTPLAGHKASIEGVKQGKTKAKYTTEPEPNDGFLIIVEP